MANNWFQFKQFLVRQNHAAMRVTTDACLFGAWLAEKMKGFAIRHSLDIGTGTGLLSLMLAQKTGSTIDAVEIDESAIKDAEQNIAESRFFDLIFLHHQDILRFRSKQPYDLIFSNPPFFERSLRSPVGEVNLARHEELLTVDQLCVIASTEMSDTGYFALLLPASRLEKTRESAARNGLQPVFTCQVKQTDKHDPFRVMMILSKSSGAVEVREEIIIRQEGSYSSRFYHLLEDYYLHL